MDTLNTLPPALPGRTASVMQCVRQRIAAREWPPGARLPSLRAMAQQQGVSKSTVVEAYDRLAAEGAIRARAGAGFYVTGPLAPLSLADIGPRLERQIDPLWVSRQSLDLGAHALKPGCGWLPDDWLPQDAIRRALRQLARDPKAPLTTYAPALGLPALRSLIARHLATRGMRIDPRHILLTDSGTQAVDLLCRFLIQPGDAVLVDDPCYFNFLALLRAHRAHIIGIPHTPDGPDMEAFEAALQTHQPRLYLSNSGPHNPTGAHLSAAKAARIRALAHKHDLILIEDDIFGDLEPGPAAGLTHEGDRDRVAQVGSFSKTLSASLRCGYLIAREDWLDALADLRTATTFSGAGLTQAVIARLLQDGSWQQHTQRLRQRLARAMPRAITLLRALGLQPWLSPTDGMFVWCRLPAGLDGARLAQAGLQQDLMLAPGNVFSQSQTSGDMMRFNVSQMDDPRLPERLATLMQACLR